MRIAHTWPPSWRRVAVTAPISGRYPADIATAVNTGSRLSATFAQGTNGITGTSTGSWSWAGDLRNCPYVVWPLKDRYGRLLGTAAKRFHVHMVCRLYTQPGDSDDLDVHFGVMDSATLAGSVNAKFGGVRWGSATHAVFAGRISAGTTTAGSTTTNATEMASIEVSFPAMSENLSLPTASPLISVQDVTLANLATRHDTGLTGVVLGAVQLYGFMSIGKSASTAPTPSFEFDPYYLVDAGLDTP